MKFTPNQENSMDTIARVGDLVVTKPKDHRGVGTVVQVTETGMSVQVAWRGFPRSWHASYSLDTVSPQREGA